MKKFLAACVAVLGLVAFGKCFFMEPLAHKISPSTIHVEKIEWDSCTQIGENTWDYSCKLPNLICNNSKTFTCPAGSCSLNRGIQCQ